MSTVWRYFELLSLGTWLGAVIFLSFAVAPGAFATLGSRDQAGAVVSMALGRLHLLGVVCGIVFLIACVLRAGSLAALVRPAALIVILMIALTVASQHVVSVRMATLRAEMGSVERTPETSPLRVEFNRLHRYSVWLETGVLLAGLAAMFLAVRDRG